MAEASSRVLILILIVRCLQTSRAVLVWPGWVNFNVDFLGPTDLISNMKQQCGRRLQYVMAQVKHPHHYEQITGLKGLLYSFSNKQLFCRCFLNAPTVWMKKQNTPGKSRTHLCFVFEIICTLYTLAIHKPEVICNLYTQSTNPLLHCLLSVI